MFTIGQAEIHILDPATSDINYPAQAIVTLNHGAAREHGQQSCPGHGPVEQEERALSQVAQRRIAHVRSIASQWHNRPYIGQVMCLVAIMETVSLMVSVRSTECIATCVAFGLMGRAMVQIGCVE